MIEFAFPQSRSLSVCQSYRSSVNGFFLGPDLSKLLSIVLLWLAIYILRTITIDRYEENCDGQTRQNNNNNFNDDRTINNTLFEEN